MPLRPLKGKTIRGIKQKVKVRKDEEDAYRESKKYVAINKDIKILNWLPCIEKPISRTC